MISLSRQFVAIRCTISPGGFSGERIFKVELANRETYRSLAPRQFCWNSENHLVAENEPATEINGMIAARVIDFIEDDQILVEVPDGEIIAVDRANVVERPTSIKPPEPKLHVSV